MCWNFYFKTNNYFEVKSILSVSNAFDFQKVLHFECRLYPTARNVYMFWLQNILSSPDFTENTTAKHEHMGGFYLTLSMQMIDI